MAGATNISELLLISCVQINKELCAISVVKLPVTILYGKLPETYR